MILPACKLPWTKVEYDTEDQYFDLMVTSDETHSIRETQSLRKVRCPREEASILAPVLSGQEYPIPSAIVEICKGKPYIDIGGHVGCAAAYFDSILSPSTIQIYEPGSRAYQWLEENFPRGLCYKQAVCGFTGECTYYPSEMMCLSACWHQPAYCEGGAIVKCVSGEDVLRHSGSDVGVLKIDAEASEYSILKSMGSWLDRVRVIYLEYHNDFLRRKCDALLDNFVMFHSKGDFLQGIQAYVHNRFAKKILEVAKDAERNQGS